MVRLFNRRRRRKAMPRRNSKGRFVRASNPRRRRRRSRKAAGFSMGAPRRRRRAGARRGRSRSAAARRGWATRRAKRTHSARHHDAWALAGNPRRRRRRSRRRANPARRRRGYRPLIRLRRGARIGALIRKHGRRKVRRAAGRWLAKHGNPRRRYRRRRNEYLTRLNPRRRRRSRRRNPVYVFNRRGRSRRRNPGGLSVGGLLARVKSIVNVGNLLDAGYTLAGASIALSGPAVVLGAIGQPGLAVGIPGIVASGVVGAGASILADKFLGRRAGEAVFKGVVMAEVAQLVLAVVPSLANYIVPKFGMSGLGYLPYGYGNDALLSSEAGARGMGSWMELGMGQLPASSLSGMGDYATTYSPVAAIGPIAAPAGEAF